jgi:hypothetical protein
MPKNSEPVTSSNWHRLRVIAGWGVCALPILALAEASFVLHGRPAALAAAANGPAAASGQPIQQTGPTGPSMPGQNDADMPQGGPHRGPGQGNSGPMSSQDWEKAEKWMEQYAPKRWAYLQSIENTNPTEFRREFREFFFPRIRQINWLQQSDSKLYDLRMKRIQLEDDAFGILQDLNSTKNSDDKGKQTVLLKGKLGEMYDNTLDERQQRINELTTFIQTEQKKLNDDQQADRREKHVENSLNRALQTGSLDNPNRDNTPHLPHGGPPATQPQ